MKKQISRVLVGLLVAVISFCALTTTVNAVAQSITLGDPETLPGYVAGTYFTTKTTSSGEYLYCLNIHKNTAKNTTATLVGERDAGVAYIMVNGYPSKSFTGERLKDYYITQTALWWYLDDTTGSNNLNASFKGSGSDQYNLRPYIKKLVNGAKQAKNNGYAKTTLNASLADNTMSLSSDGKYYISNEITVKSTNLSTYKVTFSNAPSNTTAIDSSGNAKSSFKAGEKFRIRVLASQVSGTKVNIKATVSGTGTVYKAYEYQPSDSNMQNVTPAVIAPEKTNVSDAVNVIISTSRVTITKIDKTTKQAIAGAKLVLKDASGKTITSWTSTTSARVIKNLPDGTYTVEETEAPTGYKLNKEVVKFTIDSTHRDVKVTFSNEAKERVVNIIKIDKSTGNPLAGAVIVVRDATGKEVARFTSTVDPYVITNLADGTYTVEEESAPAGYMKNSEKISFTIDAEHVSHQITIENYPEVVVPNTSSAGSIILTILGLGIIGSGIGFVYKNGKKAK